MGRSRSIYRWIQSQSRFRGPRPTSLTAKVLCYFLVKARAKYGRHCFMMSGTVKSVRGVVQVQRSSGVPAMWCSSQGKGKCWASRRQRRSDLQETEHRSNTISYPLGPVAQGTDA